MDISTLVDELNNIEEKYFGVAVDKKMKREEVILVLDNDVQANASLGEYANPERGRTRNLSHALCFLYLCGITKKGEASRGSSEPSSYFPSDRPPGCILFTESQR